MLQPSYSSLVFSLTRSVKLYADAPKVVHVLQPFVCECGCIIEIQFKAKIRTVDVLYSPENLELRLAFYRPPAILTAFFLSHILPPSDLVIPYFWNLSELRKYFAWFSNYVLTYIAQRIELGEQERYHYHWGVGMVRSIIV